MEPRSWTDLFNAFARQSAAAVGSPWMFLMAIVVVIGWIALGPTFHYSNTWQLVINTATTIITFLIVFLIQNTQNRDAKAIHLKLDELIHKIKGARNNLIALETCTDEELEQLQQQFERLKRSQSGAKDKPREVVG
jgi:low affinity Fe/Cu permease